MMIIRAEIICEISCWVLAILGGILLALWILIWDNGLRRGLKAVIDYMGVT